jgi:hypothetical protein
MIAPEKLTLALFALAFVTQAARVSLFFVFAFGDRVRVRFLNDLHFVFRLAQEAVGGGEFVALVN